MGNKNSQITFPIEKNNHYNNIKLNGKKVKNKDLYNRQIDSKNKNPKILKGYVISRISATPDRNLNIPGMNKDNISNKRYGSYEKPLKRNSTNIKNKDNNDTKLLNDNNKTIINITNLLNNIYSYEIDKELNDINLLNSGTKNINFNNNVKAKKVGNINIMFDATFKYNYYFNYSHKMNKNKNNSKYRYNSPRIHDIISDSNEFNENKNSKNHNVNHKINNIKINENINKNSNNNNNQNTTLILNKISLDDEVISINNKKKNNKKYLNQNKLNNNKKYSESKLISDSESGFVSSEELSLLNNIQKIDKKSKEEDATESQTDKQEIINHNLTNKNKKNNNYFIESNLNKTIKNKNDQLNIVNNINNLELNSNKFNNLNPINDINNINNHYCIKPKSDDNNNDNLNNKNLVICSYKKSSQKKQNIDNDEIILMNNESNKDDENNTYIEILMAMTEKKSDNIKINKSNNYKKIRKDVNLKSKEKRKQITPPPTIPIKREISPQNIENKREITPTNTTNKIILRNKKFTPLKKIQITGNINNTKNNCRIMNNSNNIINSNLSPKKIEKKSINKSNNNQHLSPKRIENCMNKSNNNSPIIITSCNSNIIKNNKNSESPSPSNSPSPSPLNHFNNNYKDRYAYKKIVQINNSTKKVKKESNNNTSNRNSINCSNNINNGNNIYNKNSNILNKINGMTNNNNVYMNNCKKLIRNSGNKNKFLFFKKERLSGNSINKIQNNSKTIDGEIRNKSNDQKYQLYNSKNVLSSTRKKQK